MNKRVHVLFAHVRIVVIVLYLVVLEDVSVDVIVGVHDAHPVPHVVLAQVFLC